MIEPQSGHGGASSSGRNANGARLVSEPAAAPTDDGAAAGPGVSATGIGLPLGRGNGTVPGAGWCGATFDSPAVSPSGFTCTPIASAASRPRNFEPSQRKL